MSLNPKLHKLLIGMQSTKELDRKRTKAQRRSIWTMEDFDSAGREGLIMHLKLVGIFNRKADTDQSRIS